MAKTCKYCDGMMPYHPMDWYTCNDCGAKYRMKYSLAGTRRDDPDSRFEWVPPNKSPMEQLISKVENE